jgi:hypothetical protein
LLGQGYDDNKSKNNHKGKNNIPNETLLKIARRIMGSRFLIIDEISLVGCKQLLEIHQKLQQVMTAWFHDPLRRNRGNRNDNKRILKNINTLPFAGLHVLFTGFIINNIYNILLIITIGDFYQLTAFFTTALFSQSNEEGRILWKSSVKYFKELTHNFRIRNEEEIFFTNFLSKARKGKVTDEDLLIINATCFRVTIQEAIQKTKDKKKTLWIATTHKEVHSINQMNKDILSKNNALTIDIIAKHASDISIIDLEKSKTLFKITARSLIKKKNDDDPRNKFPDPILSLSIGTRVKVIGNIATEIGKNIIHILIINIIFILLL